jgi:N-acyl amino acid synthase of PEP-CTERM/exosortase system
MTDAVVHPRRYFDFKRIEAKDGPWDAVQELRYAVYCVECKYLDASRYPSHRETDEFDPHSVHFAATNERQEMVATLRLVRDSSLGFPLERHAEHLSADYRKLPRDKTAEISRLSWRRATAAVPTMACTARSLGIPRRTRKRRPRRNIDAASTRSSCSGSSRRCTWRA